MVTLWPIYGPYRAQHGLTRPRTTPSILFYSYQLIIKGKIEVGTLGVILSFQLFSIFGTDFTET